jgi:hypothetical protein
MSNILFHLLISIAYNISLTTNDFLYRMIFLFMGIELAKFPQGLPFASQAEAISKPLEEIHSRRVKPELLPVGEYDITPTHPEGLTAENRYNLLVHENGTATFQVIPRSADSVSTFIRPGNPSSFSNRRGGSVFQIPQEATNIPIALINKDRRGFSVYAYIRHVPGPSPVKK